MRPNGVYDELAEIAYPATTEEIVDRLGDVELELPNGTETIEAVFNRIESGTYENPRQAFTTFLSALSTKAIGRKAYSDRDPPVFGLGDEDPRASDPLLDEDTRFDVDGPHCGICRHVTRVGDWDVIAYCTLQEEAVEPTIGDVCAHFAPMGWSYTGQ